jgi:hypothetical protein
MPSRQSSARVDLIPRSMQSGFVAILLIAATGES